MDNSVKDLVKKYNQAQILNFENELNDEEKESLYSQIKSIDFDEFDKIYSASQNLTSANNDAQYAPIEAVDAANIDIALKEEYFKLGAEAIKNGQIAVCILAGGQGTRLGYNGPKGTFKLPLFGREYSIFELHICRLKDAYKKYGVYLKCYIMTSKDNDAETQEFFKENNYFDYPKENISFFIQGELPLSSFDGKMLLKDKAHVFMAANGNGGIFKALEDSKVTNELEKNNVKYLVAGNVDNILLNPADEVCVGALLKNNVEIGIKTVVKVSPDEKVGVCVLKNNKPTVVEYIDFDEKYRDERANDGTLKYKDAHFGCNYISLELLKRIADNKLPYHMARKKNSFVDLNGNLVEATKPNSIKYEMFIFDGFEMAKSALCYRIKREDEFAPIKNSEGADSPKTAAELYTFKYKNN